MSKVFLNANPQPSDDQQNAASERDKVRILVIGSPAAVDRVVFEMNHVGFSETIEWSKPMPTDRPKESMRILTRYVLGN
jgi:hypothetical protein